MNLSALMEEDEDGGDSPSKRPPLRHTAERGREKKRQRDPTSIASSSSSESGTVRPAPNPKHPSLQRRRSRSLDSVSSRATARFAPQTLSAEVQALTLASHGDLPSIGTPGYTSLVLPRAPIPLSDRHTGGGIFGHFSFGLPNLNWNKLSLGADGKVDLTKSGIAQTTMASVEVVRGLSSRGAMFGRSGSWKVLGALGRRPSANGRPSGPSGTVGGSSDDSSMKPKISVEGTILGFTSYRAPPSYVPSQSVLVQVWAVGVDGVDGRLVGVRFGSKAKSDWDHEGEKEQEAGEETTEEVEDHDPVTKSTASQNSTSKNPFVALGRSLSLSLKRPKKDLAEEQISQLGRSFSLKPNKKPDPNSLSMSIPVANAKRISNGNATASISGSPTSTPEKKRSGTQLQHQRSKHQDLSTPSPLVTPLKLPSKPHKLKAKAKAVPIPGIQIHLETQTQSHWPPATSSSTREKPPVGTTALKERQSTLASTSVQTNQPGSAPINPKSPAKAKPKPRLLPRAPSQPPAPKPAEVGFVPGRSFVGRVLEVGWELGDEVIRKGEWVVGLVDVRKVDHFVALVIHLLTSLTVWCSCGIHRR